VDEWHDCCAKNSLWHMMGANVGIAFKILATLCFTLTAACISKLEGSLPTGEVVFVRSFISLLPLLIWLAVTGRLVQLLKESNLLAHAGRGLSGTGGVFFSYLALAYLPLAEATALSYATPLFTAMLAAAILNERVRASGWMLMLFGFVGVLIILWPHIQVLRTSQTEDFGVHSSAALLGAVFALSAALCSALSSIQIRHMTARESSLAIVLFFFGTTTIIGASTAMLGWKMPNSEQGILLLGAGFFGVMGQFFITGALRHASASLLAPFEYSSMIWSVLIGYAFLEQLPHLATFLGVAVIAGSTGLTFWQAANAREKHQQGNVV
jgi:drug/metabolite transporter (DMT)-like permease